MAYYFYDTCALLNKDKQVFEKEEVFYISSITLKELENIKTSASKDQEIKYKARKLINLLVENHTKFKVINFERQWEDEMKNLPVLSDNNDSKIIMCALKASVKETEEVIFVTQDLCCWQIAASIGLKTLYLKEDESVYTGYAEIEAKDEDELAKIYEKIYDASDVNHFDLLENQYLFVKDQNHKIIDKYKMKDGILERLPDFISFDSKMFGKVRPKDAYQLAIMDSLCNNKITMIRGAAGVGKSYLAITYLFNLLEKGKIDKIVIFCNTVATFGSAKLGFYPGSKDEKLLDSQIGNFLSSKLGDKEEVLRMIDSDKTLVLLPMSDIRGFDTTGMKAGIYITEAQNMDIELMRLALQRIGEDSICILEGDSEAQVDSSLYAGNNNGMKRVSEVFRGEDIYGELTLPNIYRSRIANIAQKM